MFVSLYSLTLVFRDGRLKRWKILFGVGRDQTECDLCLIDGRGFLDLANGSSQQGDELSELSNGLIAGLGIADPLNVTAVVIDPPNTDGRSRLRRDERRPLETGQCVLVPPAQAIKARGAPLADRDPGESRVVLLLARLPLRLWLGRGLVRMTISEVSRQTSVIDGDELAMGTVMGLGHASI